MRSRDLTTAAVGAHWQLSNPRLRGETRQRLQGLEAVRLHAALDPALDGRTGFVRQLLTNGLGTRLVRVQLDSIGEVLVTEASCELV